MPSPNRETPTSPTLNTWILQDTTTNTNTNTHVRKVLHIQGHRHGDRATTMPSASEIEALEHEAAALQLALDASKQQERQEKERRVVMEQRKVEVWLREKKEAELRLERGREMESQKEKERMERQKEKERMERERMERERIRKTKVERELELELELEAELEVKKREWEKQKQKEWEQQKQKELEKKKKDQKQKEKENEEKARRAAALEKERQREQERMLREQAAQLHKAQVMLQMRKVQDLEDAAVKRAVEESIASEKARELGEVQERRRMEADVRERKRIEAIRERLRMEEAKQSQKERLRQLKEVNVRERDWGWEERSDRRWVDEGLLWGDRVEEDMRAHVGDEVKPGVPSVTTPYSMQGGRGADGLLEPLREPNWSSRSPSLRTSRRADESETGTQGFRRRDRQVDVDRLEEIKNATWQDEWEDTRGWRESTTERWETVVRRGEGQNGYRRYREVSRSGKGHL